MQLSLSSESQQGRLVGWGTLRAHRVLQLTGVWCSFDDWTLVWLSSRVQSLRFSVLWSQVVALSLVARQLGDWYGGLSVAAAVVMAAPAGSWQRGCYTDATQSRYQPFPEYLDCTADLSLVCGL